MNFHYLFVQHPALGISMLFWGICLFLLPVLNIEILRRRNFLSTPFVIFGFSLIILEPFIALCTDILPPYEYYAYPFFLLYIIGWSLMTSGTIGIATKHFNYAILLFLISFLIGLWISIYSLRGIELCDYDITAMRLIAYGGVFITSSIFCTGILFLMLCQKKKLRED
ncbi:MAG: hypothetical protein ACYSQY_07470 [Planctomycetota bacterium]|jgi:hypothetical protein